MHAVGVSRMLLPCRGFGAAWAGGTGAARGVLLGRKKGDGVPNRGSGGKTRGP